MARSVRRLVRALLFGLPCVAAVASAASCPECDAHLAWLEANADACGYHGNRLPSICALDPECLEWNRRCASRRQELAWCLESCTPERAAAAEASRVGEELAAEVEDLRTAGYEPEALDVAWCETQRARLAAHDGDRFADGRIGSAVTLPAGVSVRRCDGTAVEVGEGLVLYPGDCIDNRSGRTVDVLMATGLKSAWFSDKQYVGIAPSTRACFPGVLPREAGADSAFTSLVSGALRSMFLGPAGRRAVLLGDDGVARFRGTDALFARDATTGALDILVRDGGVDYLDRATGTLWRIAAGERLERTVDGETSVQPLDRGAWPQHVEALTLTLPDADARGVGRLPLEACASAVGRWRWWNGVEVRVDDGGRWATPDGTASGPWRCEIGPAGVFAVIGAEDGSWADAMVGTDDGTGLHGRNLAGGVVHAQRLTP